MTCLCVCVGGGVWVRACVVKMTGCHARRKKIDYVHDLSELFHFVSWFKNGDRQTA